MLNVYSRARKHIDMKRVKELKVEKEIKKLEKQHQLLISEIKEIKKERSKHYDWRTGKDLTETMVTTGAIEVSLSAEGDTDLVGLGHETPDTSVQPGTTNVNGTYTFGPVNSEYGTASTLTFTQNIDLSLVDTLVFDFTAGDIDDFDLIIGGTSIYPLSLSSGRKVITLRQSDRKQNKALMWSLSKNSGDPVGTNRISGLALQRRTPLSVFVGLDDPEASVFMRDGTTDKVSNEEKKKRLEKQLAATKEYLNKMFGEGMPGTNTVISDTTPQKSYTEIAGYGLRPDGTQGFSNPGDEVYDPATKKNYKLVPRKGYGYNQWVPVKKA